MADVERFTKLTRELSNLEPIVKKFQAYKKILAQIEEDKNLLETGDEDLKSLAAEELADLKMFLDRKTFAYGIGRTFSRKKI